MHRVWQSGDAMKRRATKLVVFLLLGAIINVAVAWVFAWKYPTYLSAYDSNIPPHMSQAELASVVAIYGYDVVGPTRAHERHWCGARLVSVYDPVRGAISGGKLRPATFLGFFGWPMHSMTVEIWFPYADGMNGILLKTVSKSHGTVVWSLPLRPIWPGFAINTIFYAVILWLPFAAFGRSRRRRRTKRGLCPACAYPVGTNPVCTECGRAVKR